MKKKQQFSILLLALVCGLIGGFISNQLFQTKYAFAGKEDSRQKFVVAEEFRVVDKDGKILGTFGIAPYPLDLFSNDVMLTIGPESGFKVSILGSDSDSWIFVTGTESGVAKLSASKEAIRLIFGDEKGNVLWSAP